jgi:chromosome segregation ATPase
MAEQEPIKPADNQKNPEMQDTKTTIDALLELLRAKGKIELNAIAVALKVDPRVIESWAKVLENGNLVRITYEVGRMYVEPVTLAAEQQADVKTRSDVTKYILEEDLAVERISLDKFSKNIEDLNSTIGNIEKLYQQKMPDVQKILAEVDRAYAPIESKKKSMDKIKEDAEKDIKEMNVRIDALYVKLNAFAPTQLESNVSGKLERFNSILTNMENAQKAMDETSRNKNKFFESLQEEINSQVKELRKQLNSSRYDIEQNLKLNSLQLAEVMKSMKDQLNSAKQLSKEMDGFKKEFETSKRYLEVVRNSLTDRYEGLKQGVEKDSKVVDEQSRIVNEQVKAMRQTFGDVSKLDEAIKRWRKNMNDLSKEVVATKTEIIRLTNQLNTLDANRNISVEARAKTIETLSTQGKKTKDSVDNIRQEITDTADDISQHAEGTG